MKRYIEQSAPNITRGYLLSDPLEIFRSEFPDTNPYEQVTLTTSRGAYTVVSYYGNELAFFTKMENHSSECVVILTQENTTWIEDYLDEKLNVRDVAACAKRLTFEHVLEVNYGLSLNFNKFICERGHEDVQLLTCYFGRIAAFVKRSRLMGQFALDQLRFDARNSGQIVLEQVLGSPITTKGELYAFILYESEHLDTIFASPSLKIIFLEKLERLGFPAQSCLRHFLDTDIELAKKEIELLIYFSLYHYIEQFRSSPIVQKMFGLKLFMNLPRYVPLFDEVGVRDEIRTTQLYLIGEELFAFRGIETFIQYIEFKEFIDPGEVPTLGDFQDAIGIFGFEWDQLVRTNRSLTKDLKQIQAIFQPAIFEHHLSILENWNTLLTIDIDPLRALVPAWKRVYDAIIPYEALYQALRTSDIQHRVLSLDTKKKALEHYERIISTLHEQYYPFVLTRYESQDHLVCSVLDRAKDTRRNIVLLVFDGLRLDFWTILREKIVSAGLPVTIEEDIRYAIMPTRTEVSRHSIFAGRPAYNVSEKSAFEALGGTYIWSELEFYGRYDPDAKLSAVVLRFIDNRIHISSTLKGEFVEFQGIQYEFRRYIDSVVLPLLRHIFASRTVEVVIASDHGFINVDRGNVILDAVYDESFRERLGTLSPDGEFEKYSDLYLVSPSPEITRTIEERFRDETIIIKRSDYERYHVPTALGGDALVFPKVYRHLKSGTLRFNHGALSIFETMVPFVVLRYKHE